MGTLTMALAAALVAGSAPEKVSGETMEKVDLAGEWKGTCLRHGHTIPVTLSSQGYLALPGACPPDFNFLDTGNGTATVWLDGTRCEGIFQYRKDHIIICFNPRTGKQPSSLMAKGDACLLTLHRVKPRK